MLSKMLSFEYFWAWVVPLVVLATVFWPVELYPLEAMVNWILVTCWWGSYPKMLIDHLQKKSSSLVWTWVVIKVLYYLVLLGLINETARYFINM